MNLRDVLNDDYGEPVPVPMKGREDFLVLAALAIGYGIARDARIATSTNGRTMRLHNLDANTRSAKIVRAGMTTDRAVIVAFQAQMDAMPFWESESDEWGGDPWPNGMVEPQPPAGPTS